MRKIAYFESIPPHTLRVIVLEQDPDDGCMSVSDIIETPMTSKAGGVVDKILAPDVEFYAEQLAQISIRKGTTLRSFKIQALCDFVLSGGSLAGFRKGATT